MGTPILTAERLRELFHYDQNTGVFTRIARTAQRTKIGEVAGTKTKYGYIRMAVDKKYYMAHRLAWLYVHGSFPESEIDHINGERDDNRLINLRVVSRQENNQNTHAARKDSQTGLAGVRYDRPTRKFVARIWIGGERKTLGYFTDAESAHQAYMEAKRIHHAGSVV